MKSLEAVLEAVDGLNERLSRFIEFSKPIQTTLKSVVLQELIQEAADAMKPRGSEQGVKMKISVSDKVPVLSLDPEHLHLLLSHLFGNALDAMPGGGSVEIKADYDLLSQTLTLSVRDEGTGILPEHLKAMGSPFFTTKPGSVGLGLATAKRLLRVYEGDLHVESKPDEGTTVTCRLHARPGENSAWAA